MAPTTTSSPERRKTKVPVTDRVFMLMALGLDPSGTYTDYELQSAWRRRLAQLQRDTGGNAVVAAAVNLSYISLLSHIEMPEPVDVAL